ncbi:MAG: methionine adenosyltransferase [Patescibacteria group bacterium]
MNERYIFTSESVTEGHPDKVCDQISDAILDNIIAQDPNCRTGIETLATTGLVVVAGEIRTTGYADIPKIVRHTINEIGYNDHNYGFHYDDCGVMVSIDEQSPDIAQGVDKKGKKKKEQGAGDQGLMFGYATDETPVLMPLPITLAHNLTRRLAQARKSGLMPYLGPDGKSEVAVEYQDGKAKRLEAVVIATQHKPNATMGKLKKEVIKHVITPVTKKYLDNKTKFYINATGRFVKGGPPADAGLTGRKIIIDTYGGQGSHGGGAFSGKDPSKVDRSASYMARYIAKNIVAAKLAKKCEVQLAYVIGVADPISVMVNTHGTGVVSDNRLAEIIRLVFPLRPAAIIDHLKLKRPIFKATAAYGHFGRSGANFTWEKTDKVKAIKKEAGR